MDDLTIDRGEGQSDMALLEQRKKVVDGLIEMRDQWISHRSQSGIEHRWRKARELYFGVESSQDALRDTLENGPSRKTAQKAVRSRVVINIVRPKVDQTIARLCEILLPTDGDNWGMEADSLPDEMAELANKTNPTIDPQTGQPTGLTADQEFKAALRAAQESVEKHSRVISEQLGACGYNAQLRAAIEDYVCLGPAIIEGPFPYLRRKKRWKVLADGTSELVYEESIQPMAERRDPWDVWFDPAAGNDFKRGAGVWSRRLLTRKQLRELRDEPGYFAPEIDVVLKQAPTRLRTAGSRTYNERAKAESYELYIYHGEIEPEHMQACTIIDEDGPIEGVEYGVVMIVNGHCIGAYESWREDRTPPFAVACWRDADDNPYGDGMASELENQQGVVNGAWRMLMDNGRRAGSDQVVMKRGKIVPAARGDWSLDKPNLWMANEDVKDVREVFGVFSFPSHIDKYIAIVESAMKYSDMEVNMPQMMSGSGGGNAHETLGGMELLFNNASVNLRHRVRGIDDDITDVVIPGFYDWNMSFHPDPSIKVEATINAKGSSFLLERDLQNKNTMALANIAANPRYAMYIDPEKELDTILRALKVPPSMIKLSEDQIEKNKKTPPQAPPDPKIVSAQMGLKAKELDIQDSAEQRAFEERRNAAENAIRMQTLQYNRDREQAEYELGMTDSELKRDLALVKIGADQQMTSDQIAAKERMEAMKIDATNQRFNAEASLRMSTGQGI